MRSRNRVVSSGRRHRAGAARRPVNRIASVLADSLTEMKLNVLGNSDAYELMEKGILAPLKSLDMELLSSQRDALDAFRPGDAPVLMAMQARQGQIITQMEEILRQMTQWDSFI